MLPAMRLRLPYDPPDVLHNVACLLEAVAPGSLEGDARAGGIGAGMQRDSNAGRPILAATRLRLTVFAAGESVRQE